MWIYNLPKALFTTFGNYRLTLEVLVLMEMSLPLFFLTAFPAFNKLPIITIILSPESHSSPAVIAPPGSQRRDAQAVYSRFSLRQ